MTQVPPPSFRDGAALFTDLYELTMAQAYVREGMNQSAVFELFFRELPPARNFILSAGLDRLLDVLENLRFHQSDIDYLREQTLFSDEFLDYLAQFRFTGDCDAMPEGTPVFPNEPLLRVRASLPEAQLVETLVLNELHFASLAATKAARLVLAAGGRRVIDFGSRRAHGRDAALTVARAAYLAGCDGTSLVEAGRQYGIPILGTMAHSYIQAHDRESDAFSAFLESFPESTLLVDTYDTLTGVDTVIALSRKMESNFRATAVRIDSGDLLELARQARRQLDQAGLSQVGIVASGELDENALARLVKEGAPIDGFGVGTALAVSDDAPALDMAYKLVEYDGQGRTKLSSRKAIYPGRKQVFRRQTGGRFSRDVLAAANRPHLGQPLLQPVMRDGRRLEQSRVTLPQIRADTQEQLRRLPDSLRRMEQADPAYPVEIDPRLTRDLARLREQLSS